MKTRIGFWFALIIAGLLAAASAVGQTVPVNAQGTTSLTTTEAYIGQYYFHSTDYGFLWLDTGSNGVGFVPVVGKPGLTAFPVTGYILYGDCNGHGGLGTDGTTLVVNNFSGQCWSKDGSGNRYFQSAFGFSPPNAYIPAWSTPVGGSPQQADPQGRRWGVQTLGPSQYAFYVVGSGPTPGPPPATYTPSAAPTEEPTVRPTSTPGGTICGPVSSGQCFYCATGEPASCLGNTQPTSTPTMTSVPPTLTATQTGVPSTPSPAPSSTPLSTPAPSATSAPLDTPTPEVTTPPTPIQPAPTASPGSAGGGCRSKNAASGSIAAGLVTGLAILYWKKKGSL